jgi:thiamine pyrophosphokinase
VTVPPASPRPMHALVVADGRTPTRQALDAAWPGWDDGVALVVAADGGAKAAERLGLRVDLVVGDADSLDLAALDRLAAAGTAVERSPTDKDETDTELALLAAIRRGAERLTILGALGGRRLDHELANLWLLAHPALGRVAATILDDTARIRLLQAPDPEGRPVRLELPGPVGALVSLLPFGGDALGITTQGLRYPLRDEPLRLGPARGISNVRLAPTASVLLRAGRLLVVEHPATLSGS